MALPKPSAPPPIRRYTPAIRSLYVSLYAATYTPDSPIRGLYVSLYAGPYTPECCFEWFWPPFSPQKQSSTPFRPSHRPSIFPVFIAPLQLYADIYVRLLFRYLKCNLYAAIRCLYADIRWAIRRLYADIRYTPLYARRPSILASPHMIPYGLT